jgi:PAS domain S-box-containing protein
MNDNALSGLIAAVDQASDGIVLTDSEGIIRYVNPAFTAMTGYSSEEAIGKSTRMLKSGRNPDVFYQELWNTIRGGRVWSGRLVNRRKDGCFYDEEMRIAPVVDADGENSGYIAIKRDVTEQQWHEQTQALLASIVEASEDAIFTYKPGGGLLTWNRGAKAIFGYSAEEVIGKPLAKLVSPERIPFLPQFDERLMQGEVISQFETRCVPTQSGSARSSSTRRWVYA